MFSFAERFRPLVLMILLLAACGLAGHFVTDALCGSYIVTEHDCQERPSPGSSMPSDCCAHPSFVPHALAIALGILPLGFGLALAEPPLIALASPPPFRPPILTPAAL